MKHPPAVSVLMAVYNTANYVTDALHSISNQTFTDFELLVIDDGSTDGSTELLEAYASSEPRMRLITRTNCGLIATRNELLHAAQASLIAWMDSDDISVPERLSVQVNQFQINPQLTCFGGFAQCIDPTGNLLNIEKYPLEHQYIVLEQLQNGAAMRFPTTMMRKDAAINAGGFREPFRIGEDFDLLLRLSESGQMGNSPQILYFYRQHLSSVCATLGPQWFAYRDVILALALERRETGRDRLQMRQAVHIPQIRQGKDTRLVAQTYKRWAGYAAQNKNRRMALKYTALAIKSNPYQLHCWKLLFKLVTNWDAFSQ